MQNDSIGTLLLRHYGSLARTPIDLEEKLRASLRQEVAKLNEQEQVAAYLRQHRFSRRKAVRLVAMGTAGLSVLSVGMASLRTLEAGLLGQDVTKPAYS